MKPFQKGPDQRRWRGGKGRGKLLKQIDAWAFAAIWYDATIPVTEIARRYGLSGNTVSKLAKRYGLTPRMVLLEKAKLGPWKRKAAA